MLACLLFGFAEAASNQMQGVIPYVRVEYIQIIPYVVTMFVLAGFIGGSRAPHALGQPYEKEQ
jgi:simple sugar transport system permease protein